MTRIRGPEDKRPAHIEAGESKKTKQVPSKIGGWLSRMQARLSGFFSFQKLFGKAPSKEVTAQADEIINKLSQFDPKSETAYRQFLKPLLLKKNISELKQFYSFLEKGGTEYIRLVFKAFPLQEGKEKLKMAVNHAIGAMNIKAVVPEAFPYTAFLLSSHSPKEVFDFFDHILQSKGAEKSTLKNNLPDLLSKAYKHESLPVDFGVKLSPDISNVIQRAHQAERETPVPGSIVTLVLEKAPANARVLNPIFAARPYQEQKVLYQFLQAGGIVYFQSILSAFPKEQWEAEINKGIDAALAGLKANPDFTTRLFTMYPDVKQMIGSFFTPQDPYALLHASLTEIAANKPYHEAIFLMANFEKVVSECKRIQNKRPEVLKGSDTLKDSLAQLKLNLLQHPLSKVAGGLCDISVLQNTQVIYQNIAAFIYPDEKKNWRTITNLKSRLEHHLSPSEELHPDKQIQISSERIVVDLKTNLSITNPLTLATRTLRLDLPIKGEMTQTQAFLRTYLLFHTCSDEFDTFFLFKKEGEITPDEREILKQIPKDEIEAFKKWVGGNDIKNLYTNWWDRAQTEFGKLIFDLNATPTRPEFSFALEAPEMRMAIMHLNSPEAAVKAAAAQNLFSYGLSPSRAGSLSLLPPVLDQPFHRLTGTLSRDELENAYQALASSTVSQIVLLERAKDPQSVKQASLAFETKEITIEGDRFIELQTIISFDKERTATRTTKYPVNEGENEADVLKRITDSGLLHRDLLLAKAQFMEKHTL